MWIRDLLGLPNTKGTIGIEIEVEGRDLPANEHLKLYSAEGWKAELDGSLKALEAYEYVLKEPASLTSVGMHLNSLWSVFNRMESEVWESPKAGVHVHFNVQEFTIPRLANLLTLFFIFEKPLVKFCGDNREGNLFCLRASDAIDMIPHITRIIRSRKFHNFNNDDYRYSSINLKSVVDYGSVEFRTMRSTPDKSAILLWVRILNELYKASDLFDEPRNIIAAISGDGYQEFMKHIFPNTHKYIPVSDTFDQDIYDGICNAQDIAYCVKWDSYSAKRNNPFM